jgi:hypothetical protein
MFTRNLAHSIYVGLGTKWKWQQDHYMVVSCDPAVRNFALRIEKRYKSGEIVMIDCEKFDLADTPERSRYEILYDHFDRFRDKFRDVHIFVCERQLPKNFDARQIAQHAMSYFIGMRHETRIYNPVILDISSKNKGYQLGVPPKCPPPLLKKWAILRAAELFKARKDEKSYELLETYKKKDDISDTAVQIEALFRMLKLPLTEGFDHDKEWTVQEIKDAKVPTTAKVSKAKAEKVPRGAKAPKGVKPTKEPPAKKTALPKARAKKPTKAELNKILDDMSNLEISVDE